MDKKFIILFFSIPMIWTSAHAEIDIYGFAVLRGGSVESQTRWLDGGFGQLDVSSDDSGSSDYWMGGEAQLALDFQLGRTWGIYTHLRALAEEASDSSRALGLVEAYFEYQPIDWEDHQLSFRLGQMFLPSSQENTDELWQSPYTLTLSAWNSWLGQEFRPIGLNGDYSFSTESGSSFGFGALAFIGNDSLGSQLAWGGWRMSRRLSVYGEVLPLPPLFTLEDGSVFSVQRDDGSQPFGEDLDNRIGYGLYTSYSLGDTFSVQINRIDNRGDRLLHQGEYAWRTSFDSIGGHWAINAHWDILFESAKGESGMGEGLTSVDIDFKASYLLLSRHNDQHRVSLRYDRFENEEKDFSLGENNQNNGHSWTLAYHYFTKKNWRFSAEWLELNAQLPSAAQSGFEQNTSGRTLTFEIRKNFGS